MIPNAVMPYTPYSVHVHGYEGGKCASCKQLATAKDLVVFMPKTPGNDGWLYFYHAVCSPEQRLPCNLCRKTHDGPHDGSCLL